MTTPPLYNLSFTAASLRPELAGILAEHYLDSGSWDETKEWALSTNALQCSSATSSNRLEREIRPRLQTLTADQLELLSQSGMDSKTALSWLAAVKKSPFLFDFSSELLRNKLEVFDVTLRPSDYENFIEQHTSQQSQLADISESSLDKLRRVLLHVARGRHPGRRPRIRHPFTSGHPVRCVLRHYRRPSEMAGSLPRS